MCTIKNKCLNDLAVGERGRISALSVGGSMRRRLLDLGLTAGSWVECVGQSPCGDPRAYLIRGAVIAIRRMDGREIALQEGVE